MRQRRRRGSERTSHSHRVAQRVSSGAQGAGGLRGSEQYLSGAGGRRQGWATSLAGASVAVRQPGARASHPSV